MNERDIKCLDAPLILVGGDSRAAAAIAARNGKRRVILVARRNGLGERISTSDYRLVPDGVPFARSIVVNCVGSDRGNPADLAALNVDVPVAWARAAAEGGANQFIQISSFSVYGLCKTIEVDTPTEPVSEYGRSKRDAEVALGALAGIATSILRVPILVSPAGAAGSPDKLAQLANLAAKAHVVPAPANTVERSMISYDAMARAVQVLQSAPRPIAIAADPQPFTYELLAEVARSSGVAVVRAPVPAFAVRLLSRTAPSLANRLFASSALTDGANLLSGHEDFLRLREVIGSHFRSPS